MEISVSKVKFSITREKWYLLSLQLAHKIVVAKSSLF